MIKVLCIVGSTREGSFNRALGEAIAKLFNDYFKVEFANLSHLPLYHEALDKHLPESIVKFKEEIADADSIIFITPEYNRSIPALLKNAIDIGSRPAGMSSWVGKPAGVLGTSMGALGTALAQQHLRQVLAAVNMPVLPQPDAYVRYHGELLAENGDLLDTGTKAHLEKWVSAYEAWVKRFI